MNWSEIILIVLLGLAVPIGFFIYEMGEQHGWESQRHELKYILGGHTWLWVDGHFYPVDATEDQMEQVKSFQRARESITKEMIMRDANVKED
jgi:hypothetical protein